MQRFIIYPAQAQYRCGQQVQLVLESIGSPPPGAAYTVRVFSGLQCVATLEGQLENAETRIAAGQYNAVLQGFGVVATVEWHNGQSMAHTAFDVADGPGRSFRYGFLCGFAREDEGDTADVKQMARQHITHVQFYDWMYRHEQLLPPADDFTDLMGRSLSLRAVREKLALCHSYGMRALAYGAVYAASHAFYKAHKDWALCGGTGEAYDFIGKLKIMGLSAALPWRAHIINQYVSAIDFGFDGIHIDTYGCPKWGKTQYGNVAHTEYLEREFPGLIEDTRAALVENGHADSTLVLNNVGNWPVDTVASSSMDAFYIEVWPPYNSYDDLAAIIENAKRQGGGKPVVLAAYIKPFLEGNEEQAQQAALLTMAVISAHGAFHLALGEADGILSQAYYVNHARMTADFSSVMRRWCDFTTQHGHLLYDTALRDVSKTHMGWDNYEYALEGEETSVAGHAGSVYAILRERPGLKLVSLINLTASDGCWNTPQRRPAPVRGIRLKMAVLQEPEQVYAFSPDVDEGMPVTLKYTLEKRENGLFLCAKLPTLFNWACIAAEFAVDAIGQGK